MSDYEPTIRIRRPPRIRSDEKGRTVWVDPVETSDELELVSTQKLQQILESNDKRARKAIEAAANGKDDGVLAHDPALGTFEIIADADLQQLLDNTENLPPVKKPADIALTPAGRDAEGELSLVSTQALRKLLLPESPPAGARSQKKKRDTGGGFDPYDSG
jgi:hypothetical protein